MGVMVVSAFSTKALSVSSISNRLGSSPDCSGVRLTTSNTSWRLNCRGETFTDNCSDGRPSFSQAFVCSQAVLRSHSLTGMIKPVSSATGMKSFGKTNPRSGCCQRNSASQPVIRADARSKIGW